MKQTAVEWLEMQLFNKQGKFNKSDIEQAKEMEKEQIIQAFCCGGDGESEAEIYYNEMFKNWKQ